MNGKKVPALGVITLQQGLKNNGYTEPTTTELIAIANRLTVAKNEYAFSTDEEVAAWNARQKLRPQLSTHWSIKAARIKRRLALSIAWKRLAKKQRLRVKELEGEMELLQVRLKSLREILSK